MMQLSWASQKRLAQELACYKLTVPQYITLQALMPEENGATMSQLADASFQVAATMTGIIDRLVEQKMVKRTPDPLDRRAQRVILTPTGKNMLAEIEQRRRARMQQILETFSTEERIVLCRLIQKYLDLALKEIENTDDK